MSSYVKVESYGERITVCCDECATEERYFLYKTANAAAREHNLALHPGRVKWAS